MSCVLLHIDFDWWSQSQADASRRLTPLLLAQEAARSANVFGTVHSRRVYASWESLPESYAQSFRVEGFHIAPSLSSPEGWASLLESIKACEDPEGMLTVVLVSGDRSILDKAKAIREMADELVVWLEGTAEAAADDVMTRVDRLSRVFRLREPGCCILLDFEGLVELVASCPWATDVESTLERLQRAVERFGAPTIQLAFADWHMLPVLRDRSGDPMTHEVQTLLRSKGYRTVEVHPELPNQTELEQLISRNLRTECSEDTILFVGRGKFFQMISPLLGQTGRDTHIWSDHTATVPDGISWQPLEDVLSEAEEEMVAAEGVADTERRLLPSLWSRVALFVDRLMQDVQQEWVGERRLAKALAMDAPFVSGFDQSRSILAAAVSHGILHRREAKGRGGDVSYQINVDHPLLVLIRDLLKNLIEELGEDPGDGRGYPLYGLIEKFSSADGFGPQHNLDRRGLLCWINYLVDEGVLIRFSGTQPDYGTNPVPCIAFSPAAPPSEKGEASEERSPEKEHRPRRTDQISASQVPSYIRELLLVAVDDHLVRHRRTTAPVAAIRKHMAFCSGRLIDDAIRECIREGDLRMSRQSGPRSPTKNGGFVLNRESKAVRHALSRRDRVLSLLKQMAPMGQPIGEERMFGELITNVRIKDRDEAAAWVALFLKEHLLNRERQLAAGAGPSYTLALDDPVLMQAHRRFSGKDYRRKDGRRHARSGGRRGSGHSSGRRRRT